MKSVRIAAVVFNALIGRAAESLERMASWVEAACSQGAAVVCFPELNVTGYGTGPEVAACAEPIPGPISRQLAAMAGRHGVLILAGLAEKAADGRIFASHVAAAPTGILGVYRKLHIAPPEQRILSGGDPGPLFDAAGIRFGIQLCYDAHFPELSTRMALAGAEVIFMPHASPRGTPAAKRSSWMRHLPARAFDNGLFVVACNLCGENGAGLGFPGLAVVIGPDGRLLAEYSAGKEGLLVADLSAEHLAAVRNHPMRYFLPNRREDLLLPGSD
jgi:N-carbamoylputrescine amidase